MELFKTLEFKKGHAKNYFDNYAIIVEDSFGGCDIPQLMTIKTTIDDLKKYNPNLDFERVQLITIKLDKGQ